MILIIEDDVDIREELADMLRDEGLTVAEAGDGAEAIALLERGPALPTVILLDLMMPGMDGWEFRARQRRDERLKGIPVVVMSGAGDVKTAAAELAVEGVLVKPFDSGQVLDALSPFLTAL